MKVYTLRADVNNYRGIYFTDGQEIVAFDRRFTGVPLEDSWNDEESFRFVPADLPKGDTPGLSTHIPVFGPRAIRVLWDLLEGNGELLPIHCEGEEYFVFNVTRVVDAVDEANCEIKRFTSGRIMDIVEFSFFPENLSGIDIFKVPEMVLMDVFVTDAFVQRVRLARLKGFKFRQVWSSDTTSR